MALSMDFYERTFNECMPARSQAMKRRFRAKEKERKKEGNSTGLNRSYIMDEQAQEEVWHR